MTALKINWSNKLERLAGSMFDSIYGKTGANPMTPRCIVTNSPVMQAWLRHYFIFDWSKRNGKPVLANCDFQLLAPFINDWMDKLLIDHTGNTQAERNPRNHPYSPTCLQWRIYKLLAGGKLNNNIFEIIHAYLGDTPTPRRQFQLAGKLAKIFDDYQVYRCDIVNKWDRNTNDDWQSQLWRILIEDNKNSYAALFSKINSTSTPKLMKSFASQYEQVAVFGTTTMPIPYISFLNQTLAKVVDVDIYVLNPGKEYWLEDVSEKQQKKIQDKLEAEELEIEANPLAVPEHGHDLLCSMGESLQEYLYILNEQCYEGEDDLFEQPKDVTVLGKLQKEILNNVTKENSYDKLQLTPNDDSIQIHICHSARREVAILHDHLLEWLTTENNNNEKLQPYQIQVLVSDMSLYAPHIDAIFSTTSKYSTKAIPYAIDARTSSADSEILNAFISICNIVTSRFQVTSIIDLLANESILESFDLTSSDLTTIEKIVSAGNIRWGLDVDHRQDIADVTMPAYMTWEYGLDRLLTGYATGESDWHDDLLTSNHVEGSSAIVLGKLTRFIHKLKYYKENSNTDRTLSDWYEFLAELLDTFFSATENTYREISRIQSAINDLIPLKTNSGTETVVPFEVIISHLNQVLSSTTSGDNLTANSVIFCQLRPMNSRPAEITCILGLNDGAFPRKDNRPTFDLMAQTRRKGDRSLRRDDRCAFLEAIINARRKFYLSYTGRSDQNNEPIPPSIVLQELKDYLTNRCELGKNKFFDGNSGLPFETLHHLSAIHQDYFNGTDKKLFSYSTQNLLAAKQLINNHTQQNNKPHPLCMPNTTTDEMATEIDLHTLKDFFINPAKHFYYNQGIQLGIHKALLPDDDEPLGASTLDAYNLKIIFLTQLIDNNFIPLDNTELIKDEKVEGHIPLSKAGDDTMQNITDVITTWLDSEFLIQNIKCTIKDAVKAQSTVAEKTAEIKINKTIIRGSSKTFKLKLASSPEAPILNVQLEVRPAGLTTKDKIRAWISHLFACSVLKNKKDAPHTIIIGIDSTTKLKCKSTIFTPLDQEDAKENLTKLLELYSLGRTEPLPFAPNTSEACYNILKEPQNEDLAQRRAIYSAKHTWGSRTKSRPGQRPECMDNSFFHAFGEYGPMYYNGKENQAFFEISRKFFEPILNATQKQSAQDEDMEI